MDHVLLRTSKQCKTIDVINNELNPTLSLTYNSELILSDMLNVCFRSSIHTFQTSRPVPSISSLVIIGIYRYLPLSGNWSKGLKMTCMVIDYLQILRDSPMFALGKIGARGEMLLDFDARSTSSKDSSLPHGGGFSYRVGERSRKSFASLKDFDMTRYVNNCCPKLQVPYRRTHDHRECTWLDPLQALSRFQRFPTISTRVYENM